MTQEARSFTDVSEAAGVRVTREAVDMLYTRYALAARLGEGKDVLEVACGPGHGLGLVRKKACRVVGGDYAADFVRLAQRHYQGRVPILRFDAQQLPFAEKTFDLILLLEALYYIPDATKFVSECRRVLRSGGQMLLCSANKEWAEFNPSPLSTRYFSAAELADLLKSEGFRVELYGAFPVNTAGTLPNLVRAVRRTAVRFHLIPNTMKAKEFLKRVFYGRLQVLAPEITEDSGVLHPITSIPERPGATGYKVIYVIGHSA